MLAVTMARDEEDFIDRAILNLIGQGCRVVVADNMSVDRTAAIARECGATVVQDSDPAYWQAPKMTKLARDHAEPGEWVIPFDADELWDGLRGLTDDYDVAKAAPVVMVPDGDGSFRCGWTEPQPKVAYRFAPEVSIDYGNHYVFGAGDRVLEGVLTVRHYQYRSLEQVKRKVRQGTEALEAAGLSDVIGTHWRDLARLSDAELEAWWADYCHR